jgi:predicted nuclease of predicted toxin-antitoxin system
VKILVDVSAGQTIGNVIQVLGHDTALVRDRDPTISDVDILAWAVAEARLVVTMDKDFGDLVYRSKLPHAGVLLLRRESVRAAQRVQIVTDIFAAHAVDLPGHFSVYQNGRCESASEWRPTHDTYNSL